MNVKKQRRKDESGVLHHFDSAIAGVDWIRGCISGDGRSCAGVLESDSAGGAAWGGFVVGVEEK